MPEIEIKGESTKLQKGIKLSTHVPHQSVWPNVLPGVSYLGAENHLQNTFTWIAVEFFSIIILLWLMIPLQIQLPKLSLLTGLNERVTLSLTIFIPFWNHSYFITGLGFDVVIMQSNVYLVFSIGVDPLDGVTFGMSISRNNKTRNCCAWKDKIWKNALAQQQNRIWK